MKINKPLPPAQNRWCTPGQHIVKELMPGKRVCANCYAKRLKRSVFK